MAPATAPAAFTATTTHRAAASEELLAQVWESVMAFDEAATVGTLLRALDEGTGAEDLLLDVIAAVQGRVGREWAANRITVAQEHAATAINDRAVAAVALHRSARGEPTRGRITVACVDGEWHALPARLLAEVLRIRGWHVDYLGAQVPAPHLVAHLHRTGPDAVALSGSLATRLPAAHAAITACQAVGTPVIVGGAAFGPEGRYARLLGADAWAPDARAAADELACGPLPRPRPGHQAVDDLPHLDDQEYTLVARSRPRLVRAVFHQLENAYPAMRTYTEVQRERTAEDLSHVVEFLAAALYTGDEELFRGFLLWTAGVLDARGVPAASLLPALELLERELQDFPRTTATLRAGAAGLTRTLLTAAGTAE
ncbi:cobalamin B12-binding domain-containing protein [Streptomyces erythrochromogenes]|uniref:cobalamin B12-binding domain-containing protein n=1 Tax=Streptomyces erythrochromogenes TaxID=285574 RepID=UPI0022519CEF|nr:cobalamin-dependent protein [Streptomyces erythrochromogenes]MCX5588777.1 cobalamin-dependent protein [Streptomyces erythrochromogenes]